MGERSRGDSPFFVPVLRLAVVFCQLRVCLLLAGCFESAFRIALSLAHRNLSLFLVLKGVPS